MKNLLIFSVVAIAVIYQSGPVQADRRDDAERAFHDLRDIIDRAVKDAQQTLHEALDTVRKEAADVEDHAKHQLDRVLDPLHKKLDDLVERAKARGFDISKCQNIIDKFTHTREDLEHELRRCIEEPTRKAQEIVDHALDDIKRVEESLDHIRSDIEHCEGDPAKKDECYGRIIEDILRETKDAPVKLLKDAADAAAVITGLVSDLGICSMHELEKIGEDAAKDVDDFAHCSDEH